MSLLIVLQYRRYLTQELSVTYWSIYILRSIQVSILCALILRKLLPVLAANLGMPTLISTMPSSMKLPPNLCLAAPRATTSLSGQLPISSTFVNGTTMMIRPAPPAARFSNQMALVQSAGTKMRAPFITPGTVLPPGAKLLAHVPAQFVPMVTSMPRGKAPSGGVLTSTSATVATSLTDATLWMASMQPVLPAGTAGSETLATSNKSTVGVSSAPPGGNVVTSTLVTEGAMKQPTIRSRTDAELSASSPDKVTERKDSATEGSSDFDPVSAMEWKDGVGNLPGSDLKVGPGRLAQWYFS